MKIKRAIFHGDSKTCSKCEEKKPLIFFFKHNQTSDGFHSWCKSCCTNGNIKSREKNNSTIEGRAKVFLLNAKRASIKRNQEFDLTIEDVVYMWESQHKTCAYSGVEMTLATSKKNSVSIERIDSNIGYTKENTILVCRIINQMKSNFSFEDFFEYCKNVTVFLSDENLNLNVLPEKK